MEFLNKSLAQLGDLFRSMTPGARLTAALLLAVVVVSVGYLFQHGASGPDAFLFGGKALSDGELTSVEAAIAQAGLLGAVREGNRISVPAGQQAAYLAAVADAGALPPDFNKILEDALGKGGPWESREQTRERLKIARQQTLSEIVRAMNWVENAVVLYDERDTRGLRELTSVKHASASVSVKPISGETLTAQRAKNIQKLVANAVNMQSLDVAVINLGEGGSYGSDGEVMPDLFPDGSLMHTKVAYELQKRDSIMKALRDIPGVRVEVSADFDTTYEDTTHSVKPDPQNPVARESNVKEESKQGSSDNGGRPGETAQGPYRQPPSPATPQPQNETTKDSTETVNAVGVTDTVTLKKGYQPREVWATVVIPSNYIEGLWKLKNPANTTAPKPEDLTPIKNEVTTNVEEIVEPLVKLQINRGQDHVKFVRVKVIDSLPNPAIAPPSFASTATSWLSRYWSTLGMLGVAMFSLLVLRSVVGGKLGDTGGAPAAAGQSLTLHTDESTPNGAAADDAENERPRLRLKKGSSIKDDLVEIVREDPDAAADILRSWIAKAG
jgi:flagellar M-ring protein FliF